MEFSVKSGSPEKQRSACIVVGVYEPVACPASPNNWTKSVKVTSATCCVAAIWKVSPGRCCSCIMYPMY